MARSPVTRAQVDAYRFGLRRMESALVRRDPVPLHEELRGQRRAVAVGVVVSMLGLAAAGVYGLVAPHPNWSAQAVVVGRSSGALYVVAHRPDRLVPVANLAAARLVLAALGDGSAANAASDGAASTASTTAGAATPVIVDDADLAEVPRTAQSAVAGAPAVLPIAERAPQRWAVCDSVVAAPGRPAALTGTTVVSGSDGTTSDGTASEVAGTGSGAGGAALGARGALLLRAGSGQVYLVSGGKRMRVNMADPAVVAAFDLVGTLPRPASAGLLGAIPEAPPLVMPTVPGRGSAAPGGLPGRVGDVLRVERSGSVPRYYVIVVGGVQQVSPPVAELLGSASHAPQPALVRPEVIAAAKMLTVLDVADYPADPPAVAAPGDSPTACWGWSDMDGEPHTTISVGRLPPVPQKLLVTRLAQADGAGDRLDEAFIPAVGGLALRGLVPGQHPATGELRLLSASGVAYGVRDAETAAALGISDAVPAPEAVLRLLPAGQGLDLAQARKTVDAADGPPMAGRTGG